MTRRMGVIGMTVALSCVAAAIVTGLGGQSGSLGPGQGGLAAAQSTPALTELERAFVRISERVGPAVVSISTEQIERVRQYHRVHPFFGFGDDPFEDLFRQFHGPEAPFQEFRRFGLGSGVIIDPGGFILTNEHVIANADRITISLPDGREFEGTVVGEDPRSDLAVIKVDATGLPSATLGESDGLRTGQWVVALGNPFGLMGGGPMGPGIGSDPTLTVGVVSAQHRQLPRISRDDRDYTDLIQTDAAINRGNSGGPLVNLAGEIIGINVAIVSSTGGSEGVGFAIPVSRVRGVVEHLIRGEPVEYGWLGVRIQDITQDVAEYYGLKDRQGVLVYHVLPDGPASEGGLRDGDIIVSYEGRVIGHTYELINRVGLTRAGKTVDIGVLRNGKSETIKVTIGERPTDGGSGPSPGGESWRGLQIAELSADTIQRFELPPGTRGVLVVGVDPGSAAASAGLRPGDVINEINRVPVDSLDDYRKAVSRISGSALVRTGRGYVVVKEGR